MPVDGNVATCVRCVRERKIRGRGLCVPCYVVAHRNGTLDDWPRATLAPEDFVSDYELLASEGLNRAGIAARLGMSYDALDKRLTRYRQAGLLTPPSAPRLGHLRDGSTPGVNVRKAFR
jgi:hypothetical protein